MFLVDSNLFSQTRDKFGTGSGIVIPELPYPDYILKIFFYFFILYFNINNTNNNNNNNN